VARIAPAIELPQTFLRSNPSKRSGKEGRWQVFGVVFDKAEWVVGLMLAVAVLAAVLG
jgi:hypothetical protein